MNKKQIKLWKRIGTAFFILLAIVFTYLFQFILAVASFIMLWRFHKFLDKKKKK